MAGIGSERSTYEAMQKAIEAYARETYGEEYVLQDFIMLGFVVSMEPEDVDKYEYIMASSSQAPHIIEGLIDQSHLFREHDEED
jgi:hypothetical protein